MRWTTEPGKTRPRITLYRGHALEVLSQLPSDSVMACITSPPAWPVVGGYPVRPVVWPDGWRGHLGTEPDPESYISHLVAVFREVRRVLHPRGILWLSLVETFRGRRTVGIPWRTALAMVDDGWRLRQELIWHLTNAPRDEAADRFRRTHEHLLMFVRSSRYRFDAAAHRLGSLWALPVPRSYPGSTFYNSPPELVRRCLAAGAVRTGEAVLDPFVGSGTVLAVAAERGCAGVGIEVNRRELRVAARRLARVARVEVVDELVRRAVASTSSGCGEN
jgi:DNA modification methylase